MTLNVNLLLCRQFYACCDKLLNPESRGIYYKVALYHSILPIKFDDDIQEVSWSGVSK